MTDVCDCSNSGGVCTGDSLFDELLKYIDASNKSNCLRVLVKLREVRHNSTIIRLLKHIEKSINEGDWFSARVLVSGYVPTYI